MLDRVEALSLNLPGYGALGFENYWDNLRFGGVQRSASRIGKVDDRAFALQYDELSRPDGDSTDCRHATDRQSHMMYRYTEYVTAQV